MSRRSRLLADAWALLLSVAVVGPLLWRSGLPVARDAVFAPDPPWTWQLAGLGGAAPRAVPVDALVTAMTGVLGADATARVAVLLPLLIAGAAAHRAVEAHGPIARALATSLAVLNPLTVGRLALGQWALLWTWAALWLLLLLWRRHGSEGRRGLRLLIAALGSLTPSGGLTMLAMTVLGATADRGARRWLLPVAVALLQLPWVVAGLVGGSSSQIDPRGFEVFAARDETGGDSAWGAAVTLLSLGGLWDTGASASSRAGAGVVVVSAIWLALALIGSRPLRAVAPAQTDRWALAAAGGALIALAPTTAAGRDLLVGVAAWAPGAGLLRDSQKWVLPFGVLMVAAAAAGAGALARRAREPAVVAVLCVAAALAPWWALPDGPRTVHRTLEPVTYPPAMASAAALIEGGGAGDIVTVPWRSYRRFDWATDATVYDPASRWFARPVVTDDRLVVDDVTLAGESPRAAELTELLDADQIDGAELAAAGVRWIVVYRDDPRATELSVTRAHLRLNSKELLLYEVSEPVAVRSVSGRIPALLAGAIAAAVLLGAAANAATGLRRRP